MANHSDAYKRQPRVKGSFSLLYEEPLSKKIYATQVPKSVAIALEQLPNKNAWLKRVIYEAARQELMQNSTVDSFE